MNLRKFGAIDIGTNAMRLLVCNVVENGEHAEFRKASLIRVPVRLGSEVFKNGFIGEENEERLLHAMKAFWHFMRASGVVAYKGCATSAMREAQNGQELADHILQKHRLAHRSDRRKKKRRRSSSKRISVSISEAINRIYTSMWAVEVPSLRFLSMKRCGNSSHSRSVRSVCWKEALKMVSGKS